MPRTPSNSTHGLQLVEYSPETFRASGKKAETVPFMLVSRSGRISFNRKAVELMGSGEGECAVTLFQDSRRPRDWYLRPGDGGFPLRGSKGDKLFQHTALAARILDSLSFTGERLRIRIAGPRSLDGLFTLLTEEAVGKAETSKNQQSWK